MLRITLIVAGVALIAVLGLMIDTQSRTAVVPSLPPTQARTTIYASGRIEGATPEIELRAQVVGRVVEVLVQEGQMVQQGQVLLKLDDRQHRHEVALAAADLALMQAQLKRRLSGAHERERAEAAALYRARLAELERARLAWQRINGLSEAKAISKQEADNQRTLVTSLTAEVEAARARFELLDAPARDAEVQMDNARIEAAKARYELAKVQLEWTEVRAPCKAQILKVDAEAGELTGPESVEPAIVLSDTSDFRVRAFVEEMDAPRVRIGMAAKVAADGLPGQTLKGHIVRLSPRMSRKQLWSDEPTERYDTKTREVWIELEHKEGLVVGLRVDVTIEAGPVAGQASR